MIYPGAILDRLQFDFELHFVCLDGAEAGVTYGGIKWGFEFQRKENWIGFDWIDQFKFTSYAVPWDTPSDAWRSIWRSKRFGGK
jgi:hypothetical protein